MPRLIWSQPTLLDIARLHEFLVSKNPDAVRRAVKAIREGLRVLGRQPEIGRTIEDMTAEFREWIVESGEGACVALYHFDGKQIVVLAVRHGREAGY